MQRLPGDALQAVLVIDTSGSMTGAPMAAAKTAAIAFLAQMPPSARVAVVGFSDSPVLASPLTTDRARLTAAIGALTADGETALYDGVGLALDQLHPGDQIHRHLVLLSDGGDTASTTALDVVRRRLAGSDTRLDVAELATSESRHEPLAALAADGRGAVVSAGDPAALTPIYQSLGRGLANQYVVTFPTSGHGPTHVRVAIDHAGLRAATEITVDLPAAPRCDASDAAPQPPRRRRAPPCWSPAPACASRRCSSPPRWCPTGGCAGPSSPARPRRGDRFPCWSRPGSGPSTSPTARWSATARAAA